MLMNSLIFPAMLVGHLIGDWVLQSNYMAQNKLHCPVARFWYVLVYTIVSWLCFGLVAPSVSAASAFFVWTLITHFVIDSRRWRTSAPLFVQIAADQSLHIATMFLFMVALSRGLV
jgi:hypothetical protein